MLDDDDDGDGDGLGDGEAALVGVASGGVIRSAGRSGGGVLVGELPAGDDDVSVEFGEESLGLGVGLVLCEGVAPGGPVEQLREGV